MAGLCAASALAALVQMLILGASLRRLLPRTGEPRWRRLLLPSVMAIVTALVARAVFLTASSGPTTVVRLLIAIACGTAVYIAGSLLCGSPELVGLRQRLLKR